MNAGRPTYQSFSLGDWQATAPLSQRYSGSSTRYFEPVKTNSAIPNSDWLHLRHALSKVTVEGFRDIVTIRSLQQGLNDGLSRKIRDAPPTTPK
jgi:hypothetical protein